MLHLLSLGANAASLSASCNSVMQKGTQLLQVLCPHTGVYWCIDVEMHTSGCFPNANICFTSTKVQILTQFL